MAASHSLVSLTNYLNAPSEKPYSEYIDGVLYRKAMPTKAHSQIQRELLALLAAQGIEAFPELTVQLAPAKFLIPDVVANYSGKSIGEPYPTQPVDLCIEILSPADRLQSLLGKCQEYHAWGVPYCWVIDPVQKKAWAYHATFGPEEQDAVLRAGKVSVRLASLFDGDAGA